MKKGIAITCVDPRLHWLAEELGTNIGVDQVYNTRLGGPDGIVAIADSYPIQFAAMVEEVKRFLGLGAVAIAFAGHTTCAGHLVDDDTHREHTMLAARQLRELAAVPAQVPVHAFLAVRGRSDIEWGIESLGVF